MVVEGKLYQNILKINRTSVTKVCDFHSCMENSFITLMFHFQESKVKKNLWRLYGSQTNLSETLGYYMIKRKERKSCSPDALIGDTVNWNQLKSNQIWFFEERRKPRRAEKRTTKLNPHTAPSLEIGPGPSWWKAIALTTTPPLLSISYRRLIFRELVFKISLKDSSMSLF